MNINIKTLLPRILDCLKRYILIIISKIKYLISLEWRNNLFINKSLRFRFVIYITSITILVYFVIGIFIIRQERKQSYNFSQQEIVSLSEKYSQKLTYEMSSYLNQAIGMANVFESNLNLPSYLKKTIYKNTLYKTIEGSDKLLSAWLNIQLFSIDSTWKKSYGRMRYTFYKIGSTINLQQDILDTMGFNLSGDYYKIMKRGTIDFSPPYYDSYGDKTEKILMTSICVPLYDQNKQFWGMVGVDIDMKQLQAYMPSFDHIPGGEAMIVTSDGTIVVNTDTANVGKNLGEAFPQVFEKKLSLDTFLLKSNNSNIEIYGKINRKNYFLNFHPIILNQNSNAWSLVVAVPNSYLLKEANKATLKTLLIFLLGLIFLTYFTYLLTDFLSKPLNSSIHFAKQLSNGNLTAEIDYNKNDELGQLVDALKQMEYNLRKMVKEIDNGSELLNKTAKTLSGSSKTLLSASYQQFDTTKNVNQNVEEIISYIHQSFSTSNEAENVAKEAAKKIRQSVRMSTKASTSMNFISEKITAINDISLQTNILALNAAVEAARAGEYGKGFSVIAGEVRRLAERSAQVAAEVTDLLLQILTNTEDAGNMLDQTIPQIEKNTLLIQKIIEQQKYQNEQLNEISQSMNNLNEATRINNNNAKNMAVLAEEIEDQAEKLEKILKNFKVS
jgi:methyl-accepting chemotaxis protein